MTSCSNNEHHQHSLRNYPKLLIAFSHVVYMLEHLKKKRPSNSESKVHANIAQKINRNEVSHENFGDDLKIF